MKELFIKSIKTLFFNIIGFFIMCESYMYMHTHDDISFLIYTALIILIFISIIFIKVDYLKPTVEEISRCAIFLYLYAANRKLNEIEKDDINELALNNSTVGEVVKELVDDIEINESKEEEGEKNYD